MKKGYHTPSWFRMKEFGKKTQQDKARNNKSKTRETKKGNEVIARRSNGSFCVWIFIEEYS